MASPASDRARPRHRRLLLLFLVVASTLGAVLVLGTILAADGFSVLEMAILALFTALFAWITTACWITVIGFVVRLVGARRYRPREAPPPSPEDKQPSTALVMPIYNESPERVVAGLRRSEEHTSELQSLMRTSYAVFCLKKKI